MPVSKMFFYFLVIIGQEHVCTPYEKKDVILYLQKQGHIPFILRLSKKQMDRWKISIFRSFTPTNVSLTPSRNHSSPITILQSN